MKVNINIDCTPEEARTFFGLPDVQPMQEVVMAEVQRQLMANLQAMEPEKLFSTWLPASLKGWEQMMKLFQGQVANMTGLGKPPGEG